MKSKLFNQLCKQIELPNKKSNELRNYIANNLATNLVEVSYKYYSIVNLWKIIYTIYRCWLLIYSIFHELSYKQIMRKNGLIFAIKYGYYYVKPSNQNWLISQIRILNLSPNEYVILIFSGCINAKKKYIGINQNSIINCYFLLFIFSFPIPLHLLSALVLFIMSDINLLLLTKLIILLLLILFHYIVFILIKIQYIDSNNIIKRLNE